MRGDNSGHFVPKLRFPEFRNDQAWSAPKFRDLYGFKRTNTLSRDELNHETGTIRNIHYGDIHTKFKPLFRVGDECVPYVNPEVAVDRFDDEAFCEEGDIVLADASEDLSDVGKAIEVVSLDGERVVAGTHTILATRRGGLPVIGFGGHLLQSAVVRAGIKKEAQGSKVYGISAKRVSSVSVPIPPTTAEQQKIADCLSSLDELIAAEDWKLEALQQHKQGLMQRLFPQAGENEARLRFSEFEKTPIAFVPLDDLCQLDRQSIRPSDLDAAQLPFVGVEHVATGSGAISFDSNSRIGDQKSLMFRFDERHVLYGKLRPYLNKVATPWFAGKSSTEMIPLLPRVGVDRIFLAHLLRRPETVDFAMASAIGSRMPRTDMETLLAMRVRKPPVAEQQKIAACLSSLDELIAAKGRKLNALKKHKRGLLQQLFPKPETS